MVARQQVDRNTDGAHRFQRLTDHLRRKLVVFEDIASDDHELRTHPVGQRAETGYRVAAGRRIPGLSLAGQEVAGHAQLPVGGVHEPHADPVLSVVP